MGIGERRDDTGSLPEPDHDRAAAFSEPGDALSAPPPGKEPASEDFAGRIGPMGPHSWVEQRIREATERGEFDNLPGAGKPLPLAESQDPDWWIKAKLKKENLDESDLVPGVIALRREAQSFPDSLSGFTREADVRAVLADYNRRVIEDIKRPTFGPSVPVVAPRIDVDAMVERWKALQTELQKQKEREERMARNREREARAAAAARAAQTQPERAPLPLLYVLAVVLAASGVAQVAVLLTPEPMLFPKPVAGVILAVAVLGLVSVITMIVRGHRES